MGGLMILFCFECFAKGDPQRDTPGMWRAVVRRNQKSPEWSGLFPHISTNNSESSMLAQG